ncbi:MAG: DUF2029 domain-containing protein [Fluviicola sp.]|nr:DUF2029 domain-containing protein [Fluviicola sp.]
MTAKRILIAFSPLVFLLSIFFINFEDDRTNFAFIAIFYTLAFIAYLGIYSQRNTFQFKHLLFIAIVAQLLSMWNEPNLSIDYYRFLWDGEITLQGINPFDFTPQELATRDFVTSSAYMQDIYNGIGSMSQANYSCYPPINQLYFIVAAACSDSLLINAFVLKLLIVLTEVLGAFFLIKLLENLKIEKSRMWLLYLNPLWIIECTGNTHFEGVMISFLFIAFYFLLQKKEILGSLFFAIAVQIKLVPLLILPFFLRFLGWRKAITFYILTILLVVAFGFIQLDSENINNFVTSLRLYFEVFEFNSFILYYYIQFGFWDVGWNMTRTYGPRLSAIALTIIIALALWGGRIDPNNFDWRKLFKRITVAFFVYLILSSTLHPWYVLPLLAFSLFTNYTFPLAWSFAIFFSYVFYEYSDNSVWQVRLVSIAEYALVVGMFLWEVGRRRLLNYEL